MFSLDLYGVMFWVETLLILAPVAMLASARARENASPVRAPEWRGIEGVMMAPQQVLPSLNPGRCLP